MSQSERTVASSGPMPLCSSPTVISRVCYRQTFCEQPEQPEQPFRSHHEQLIRLQQRSGPTDPESNDRRAKEAKGTCGKLTRHFPHHAADEPLQQSDAISAGGLGKVQSGSLVRILDSASPTYSSNTPPPAIGYRLSIGSALALYVLAQVIYLPTQISAR